MEGISPRILVVQLESLAECIACMPFLYNLRHTVKKAELLLLTSVGRSDLFQHLGIDRVIEGEEAENKREMPFPLLEEVFDFLFDLSLQSTHRPYVFRAKYEHLVGFEKASRLDNERTLPLDKETPLWRQIISLLELIGIEPREYAKYPFKIQPVHFRYARFLLSGLGSTIVCIAIGSSGNDINLSRDCIREAIAYLYSNYTKDIALLGEPSCTAIADDIESRTSLKLRNLVGAVNLSAMASILSQSKLLVSTDIGISVTAEMLGIPVVAISAPSDLPGLYLSGDRTVILQSEALSSEEIIQASVGLI